MKRDTKPDALANDRSFFLPDQPVEDEDHDEFTHSAHVEALRHIVTTCPTPFCVGVFGKWGTGKSGIARRLKSAINSTTEHAAVHAAVLFDAWQFVGDSFRRQFLIECDNQLKTGLKYQDELSRSRSETYESRVFIHWKPLALYLSLVVIGWVIAHLAVRRSSIPTTTWVTDGVTMLAVLTMIATFASQIVANLKSLPNQFTYPRIDSPEQFKQSFQELLKAVPHEKRLVLIIDNLDRCRSSRVLEVFSAMKTFLDSERCVYVVPCDHDAIAAHLRAHLTDTDPAEYLRKLFNTSVHIHPLIQDEMEQYVKRLAEMTALPIDDRAQTVLTSAAIILRNPRSVKRLINTTAADHLLAAQLEQPVPRALLTNGAITSNTGFLAKVVVLREHWAWYFDALRSNPRMLRRATEMADEWATSANPAPEFRKEFGPSLPQDTKPADHDIRLLLDFLRATRSVSAANIEDFLRFKATPSETMILDRNEFRDALLTRQSGRVVAWLSRAATESEVAAYVRYALEVTRALAAQGSLSLATNAVAALLDAFAEVPKAVSEAAADDVVDLLAASPIAQSIGEMDPRNVLLVAVSARPSPERRRLVAKLLPETLLSKDDPAGTVWRERFDLLMEFRELLERGHIAALRRFLVDNFEKYTDGVLGVLETLTGEGGFPDLLSSELLQKVISGIDHTSWSDESEHRLRLAVEACPSVAEDRPDRWVLLGDKIAAILQYPDLSQPDWTPQRTSATQAFASLDPHLSVPLADTVGGVMLQLVPIVPQDAQLEMVDALIAKRSCLSDELRASLQARAVETMRQAPDRMVPEMLRRVGNLDQADPLWAAVVEEAKTLIKGSPTKKRLVEFGEAIPDAARDTEAAFLTELIQSEPTSAMAAQVAQERFPALHSAKSFKALLGAALDRACSVPVPEKKTHLDLLHQAGDTVPKAIRNTLATTLTDWLIGDDVGLAELAGQELAAFRSQFTPRYRTEVALRAVQRLARQSPREMGEVVWQAVIAYRDDLHEKALQEIATALSLLIMEPEEGLYLRGLGYIEKLIGAVHGKSATRIVTDMPILFDRHGVDPRRLYDAMVGILPAKDWPDDASQTVKEKLERIGGETQDDDVRGWAEDLTGRGETPDDSAEGD